MDKGNFNGLVRFIGTKADYDKLSKSGKLVFAQITDATGDIAPYYLYANDREFALNSYEQLTNLENNISDGKLNLETLKADSSTKGTASNSTIYVQGGTGFSANTRSDLTYKVVYTGNSDSDDWSSIGN